MTRETAIASCSSPGLFKVARSSIVFNSWPKASFETPNLATGLSSSRLLLSGEVVFSRNIFVRLTIGLHKTGYNYIPQKEHIPSLKATMKSSPQQIEETHLLVLRSILAELTEIHQKQTRGPRDRSLARKLFLDVCFLFWLVWLHGNGSKREPKEKIFWEGSVVSTSREGLAFQNQKACPRLAF